MDHESKMKKKRGRKKGPQATPQQKAAKKVKKNEREQFRRMENNLYFELLYLTCGEDLRYNRPERVQILKSSICEIWTLRNYADSLITQLQQNNITPIGKTQCILNKEDKLWSLVQRKSKTSKGKNRSRAKLRDDEMEADEADDGDAICVPKGSIPDDLSASNPRTEYSLSALPPSLLMASGMASHIGILPPQLSTHHHSTLDSGGNTGRTANASQSDTVGGGRHASKGCSSSPRKRKKKGSNDSNNGGNDAQMSEDISNGGIGGGRAKKRRRYNTTHHNSTRYTHNHTPDNIGMDSNSAVVTAAAMAEAAYFANNANAYGAPTQPYSSMPTLAGTTNPSQGGAAMLAGASPTTGDLNDFFNSGLLVRTTTNNSEGNNSLSITVSSTSNEGCNDTNNVNNDPLSCQYAAAMLYNQYDYLMSTAAAAATAAAQVPPSPPRLPPAIDNGSMSVKKSLKIDTGLDNRLSENCLPTPTPPDAKPPIKFESDTHTMSNMTNSGNNSNANSVAAVMDAQAAAAAAQTTPMVVHSALPSHYFSHSNRNPHHSASLNATHSQLTSHLYSQSASPYVPKQSSYFGFNPMPSAASDFPTFNLPSMGNCSTSDLYDMNNYTAVAAAAVAASSSSSANSSADDAVKAAVANSDSSSSSSHRKSSKRESSEPPSPVGTNTTNTTVSGCVISPDKKTPVCKQTRPEEERGKSSLFDTYNVSSSFWGTPCDDVDMPTNNLFPPLR